VGSSSFVFFMLLPGLLLSMAAGGNAHAFSIWIAALGNLAFWFLLCWLLGLLAVGIVRIVTKSR
jgi:hypothetical protein